VLSLGLLWFVHRRSNVARVLFAVTATVGFVIYVLGAIGDLTSLSTLLAPLYAVQAATMLVRPVRAWTRAQSGGQVPARVE
jgi:hypothetical protein